MINVAECVEVDVVCFLCFYGFLMELIGVGFHENLRRSGLVFSGIMRGGVCFLVFTALGW